MASESKKPGNGLKQPYIWLTLALLVLTSKLDQSGFYSVSLAAPVPILAIEPPTQSAVVETLPTEILASPIPLKTLPALVTSSVPPSSVNLQPSGATPVVLPDRPIKSTETSSLPKITQFEDSPEFVRLKTPALQIELEKAGWRLRIADQTGNTIWEEPATTTANGELAAYGSPAFLVDKKQLSPAKAALYTAPEEKQWFHLTKIMAVSWQEPVLKLEVETNDPAKRKATVKFSLLSSNTFLFNLELSDVEGIVGTAASNSLAPDEHFFGLGQRQKSADQRGQRVVNLVRGRLELDANQGQEGSYAPYPFVLSTRGYGLLAETYHRNVFDLGMQRPTAGLVLVEAASLNLAFFVNNDPLNILREYTARIGRPPLPPPWTFGVWKTSIGGQARVEAEARQLREAQIPVSVLLSYDAVDRASGTGWDAQVFKLIPPQPYPDLATFNQTLHRLGYKTLTYVQESYQSYEPRFKEGWAAGYFVRNRQGQPYLMPLGQAGVAMLDFTNTAAVAWFQEGLRRALVDLDFDGALQDSGDLLPSDAVLANGQSGYTMANLYPVLYAKASYEAARKYKPEAVFLMRAGYLGAQQYQTATWEGDLISYFDWQAGLPATIPAALNRSISGSPFIGTEIAGYLQVDTPLAEQKELYLRWTQYGAFNPIMRDILGHQDANAIYLWSASDTTANFKRYARLHTDLFPLLYTLAKEASATGLPIMRHPYLLYPADPTTIRQDREYFLGDSLLVAPVVTYRDRQRPVYLPAGQWVNFWTGELIEGGREIMALAPLDTIPVYVKAGAIIPTLLEPAQTLVTKNSPLDSGLRVKIYPHGNGSFASTFTLYDGTNISYTRTGKVLEVTISGDKARPYRLEIPASSEPVEVSTPSDFKKLSGPSNAAGWWYEASQGQIAANLTGRKITLSFKLES